MAIGFFAMLLGGLAVSRFALPQDSLFTLIQVHKSVGVLLLVAGVFRLALAVWTSAPALPSSFTRFEHLLVDTGRVGLYGLMLAMPLTGWLMVSSSPTGLPTLVFGLFEWPHVSWARNAPSVHALSNLAHTVLGAVFAAVILTHMAAVLKHRVASNINLLPRIWFRRIYAPVIVMVSLVALASAWSMLKPASTLQPSLEMVVTASPSNTSTVFQGRFDALPERSRIGFSGVHAGNSFSGQFTQWQADIAFDSEDLASSAIRVSFDLASAVTGDPFYDATLPEADWFDVAAHPSGVFQSASIERSEGSNYLATGTLALRGKALPVSFSFQLNEVDGFAQVIAPKIVIDRLAYDIGAASDPDAEWVSREISVQISLMATSAQ